MLKLKLVVRITVGVLVDRRQITVLVVIELRMAVARGIDPVELAIAIRVINRGERTQRTVIVAMRVIGHGRDTRNVSVLVVLVVERERPPRAHGVALTVRRKGRHAAVVISVRVDNRARIARAGLGVGHQVTVLVNVRARTLAVARIGRLIDQVSIRVIRERR